jgi:hypothetical protein
MKFALAILIAFSFSLYAQVDSASYQEDLDNILEDATIDNERSGYFDTIEYLLQNKISVNQSSLSDLMKIPFLDPQSAAAIISYRDKYGKIISQSQLEDIEGISPELIKKILPFLRFEENGKPNFIDSISKNFKDFSLSFRTRGIEKIQEAQAYKDGKYDGSDWKIYNRLILSKDRNIRIGILTEKDAGEKSLNDFTTFHFYAENIGIIKNFVAGDYLFEFGQGLALWSSYSISKGIQTVGILPRTGKFIIPYLSANENMFLRGIASQINFNELSISSFYSSRQLDGSIDPLTNQITSIRLDGFHRNSNEIAHRKIINEKLFGISAGYSFEKFGSIGFLYYSSIFSNNFLKESELDPSGNRFNYISTSYNFVINRLNFSGETSYDMRSTATINSLEFFVNKYLAFLFSYRNYSKNYWGLHTNGFGEKNGTQNEIGFYCGLRFRTDFGTISFYFDQFKLPYTNEKIPFATKGNEFMLNYSVSAFNRTEFVVRYTNKNCQVSNTIADQFGLLSRKTESIRGDLIYKFSKYFQLHSRINSVGVSPSSNSNFEKGFLIFQDAKYSPNSQFSFAGRIVFFKSDSYDSRVYEFENDLTGVMTNPALYGEGTRWYIVAQYKTAIGLRLSLKYSELFKPNERILGSGDSEIQGNLDNQLSLQLDLQM